MSEQRSSRDWKEWRRFRAWELHRQGWRRIDIAEALDVSCRAVSQWLAAAAQEGTNALLSHPAPGSPAKLTPAQKRLIPEFLWHGAEAYGFRGDVWTCARVAEVIERELGVRYHKGHVARLLKELGWMPQIPVTRAVQRDEAAIERWRTKRWPQLKKRPGRSAALLFSWTNRASTCCRASSRPTGRKGEHRSCTSGRLGTTCR